MPDTLRPRNVRPGLSCSEILSAARRIAKRVGADFPNHRKETLMSEWMEMGRFKELDETARKEASRLAEYALDVALDPAKVIRFEEAEEGFRLLVDEDLYKFYQGC